MIREHFLALIVIPLALLSTSTGYTTAVAQGEADSPLESWTFMIYMAADVDDTLPWEADINEMEAASQASNANTIVLVDPPGMTDTMLLKIEHDENHFDPEIVSMVIDDDEAVIPAGGEVNTGLPGTLTDFLIFAATEYPADKLVLVMWGHGAGWRGMCPDGTDLLTLPELRTALNDSEAAIGKRLDMMVLDVCNGATLELAHEISEHVDLLVGSELNVPTEGLPYREVFDAFAEDPGQSTSAFGRAIVDAYIDWAEYDSSHATVACLMNLEVIADTVTALDSMSNLGATFNMLYHSSLVAAIHSAEHSDDEWYVDYGALCSELCTAELPIEVKVTALRAAEKYFSAVLHYAATNTDNLNAASTTGLSLYCPSEGVDDSYMNLRISQTLWTELSTLLHDDIATQVQGPGPQLTVADSPDDDDDLPDSATLTWSPDEEWNYTSYVIHVFRVQTNGYVPCQTITSTNPVVRIDGAIGMLLLSVSGCIDGEARSHQLFQATLSGFVTVEVTVNDKMNARDNVVEVVVLSGSSDRLRFECDGSVCVARFVAPDWAGVGELVTIQLVESDSGTVISEKRLLVTGEDMRVTLDTYITDTKTIESKILLGLVAIIAMACVAAVVYVNLLRRR